ncbi:MAG: recombinase family protein, partial [Proteobacteria bacterium]|nr:recombinase family protein [Pseudomonadota bacterium]
MGSMRDADPSASVVTQETMQNQKKLYAPSNPTSAGDSADSGQRQTAGPRYVELIRVSGRGQVERETPESQRRSLDRLSRTRPGIRIARIEALAVSAAIPLEQTEQGQQLLELASGGFDELRLWDVDRGLGSRADDPRDRLAIFGIAREANAVIVDCSERVIDPSKELGELDYYLRTFFAAQERRKIAQRTRAGRKRIAAEGGYAGAGFIPYGLTWDRSKRQWGIDECRAAIVRDMFEQCLNGVAAATIASELNARGVPTQQGKRWHQSTVARMLRMPAYRGEHRQEGLTIRVPAIVDETTWFAAQRLLDVRPRRRRAQKTQSPCVGRIWCPCGQRAYIRLAKGKEYVYCATHHDRKRRTQCSQMGSHRADQIDPVVWDTVAKAIAEPQLLRPKMAGNDDSAEEHREELARCEQELQRLVTSENEISRAFRRDELSVEAWRDQLKEIAADRHILKHHRAMARERLAAADAAAFSWDAVETQLEALTARVRAAAPIDRKAIIESLIPGDQPYGVTIWPDGKIDIRGGIAVPSAGRSCHGTRQRKMYSLTTGYPEAESCTFSWLQRSMSARSQRQSPDGCRSADCVMAAQWHALA